MLPDAMTLVGGAAILLVWAGLVEAFFSQYHYPAVSYSTKITVGVVELVILVAYFGLCGRDWGGGDDGDALEGGGGR